MNKRHHFRFIFCSFFQPAPVAKPGQMNCSDYHYHLHLGNDSERSRAATNLANLLIIFSIHWLVV